MGSPGRQFADLQRKTTSPESRSVDRGGSIPAMLRKLFLHQPRKNPTYENLNYLRNSIFNLPRGVGCFYAGANLWRPAQWLRPSYFGRIIQTPRSKFSRVSNLWEEQESGSLGHNTVPGEDPGAKPKTKKRPHAPTCDRR